MQVAQALEAEHESHVVKTKHLQAQLAGLKNEMQSLQVCENALTCMHAYIDACIHATGSVAPQS